MRGRKAAGPPFASIAHLRLAQHVSAAVQTVASWRGHPRRTLQGRVVSCALSAPAVSACPCVHHAARDIQVWGVRPKYAKT